MCGFVVIDKYLTIKFIIGLKDVGAIQKKEKIPSKEFHTQKNVSNTKITSIKIEEMTMRPESTFTGFDKIFIQEI